MTPTQAQIEAAARGICAETCAFMGEAPCWKMEDKTGRLFPFPPDWCDEPGCVWLAKAALTAAAEVEIAYSEQWPLGTVAAEVGPYAGIQVNKDGLVLKYTDKDLDDTEAATIERCAMVADELRLKYKTGLGCDPAIDAVLEMIAARIRALKD